MRQIKTNAHDFLDLKLSIEVTKIISEVENLLQNE